MHLSGFDELDRNGCDLGEQQEIRIVEDVLVAAAVADARPGIVGVIPDVALDLRAGSFDPLLLGQAGLGLISASAASWWRKSATKGPWPSAAHTRAWALREKSCSAGAELQASPADWSAGGLLGPHERAAKGLAAAFSEPDPSGDVQTGQFALGTCL